MQSRCNRSKYEPKKWASQDWERAWQSALRRINGMPPELAGCSEIHQPLRAMDEAFVHGNSEQFEDCLIELLDHCAELVNRGDYQQWW